VLTNYEAHSVVESAFKRANVDKIDVIFSDTCLNGMIEVLEQFRDFADVLVGSEDLEPGDGWDYQELFRRMSENPPESSDAWGAVMVEAFGAAYQHQQDQQPCTLGAFRTKNDVAKAFGALVKVLTAQKRSGFTAVQEARAFAQSFARRDSYDIKDFATQLAETTINADLKTACGALSTAIEVACVRNVALGKAVDKASGLAFWLPSDRRAYDLVADTYARLAFDNATSWTNYLSAFYGTRD
jgi:hypothetical protein